MSNKAPGANTYREIYQQPASLEAVLQAMESAHAMLDTVFHRKDAYQKLVFTGCGTSFYLAQSAALFFAEHVSIVTQAVPCSELYHFPEIYVGSGNVLVLPITRKSTTTEVRMAIDRVRVLPNVKTLAITCDGGSAEYNDYMLLSPDAAEESVVMTRSFTSMLCMAAATALYAGGKREQLVLLKKRLPAYVRELLPQADEFARRIVTEHPELNLYVTLGQGAYYGVAAESMNKMKEMGLVYSEAYYSLEYRHGPMSIAGSDALILVLAHSATRELDSTLLTQMKGFGAVTAIIGGGIDGINADYQLPLDASLGDTALAVAVSVVGQLLGYHIAIAKGLDADYPRNLSQVIVL